MSNKNIVYPTKICIENIIQQVYERVYNQLPLEDVDYPFAVFEINIVEHQLQLLIDVWDNRDTITVNQQVDLLIAKLDNINNKEDNFSVHFAGEVSGIRDVPTQDEELTRIQLSCLYNIYKV